MLEKIVSAECPKCGCCDTRSLNYKDVSGRLERYECENCGYKFAVTCQVESKGMKYIEQRIPICPVHHVPMQNNGRAAGGIVIYYKCPECPKTGKGERKIV